MPETTTVSFRVSPEVKSQLTQQANSCKQSLSTHLQNLLAGQLEPVPQIVQNGIEQFSKITGIPKHDCLTYMIIDFLAKHYAEQSYLGESIINPFFYVGPGDFLRNFDDLYYALVDEYKSFILKNSDLKRKAEEYILQQRNELNARRKVIKQRKKDA